MTEVRQASADKRIRLPQSPDCYINVDEKKSAAQKLHRIFSLLACSFFLGDILLRQLEMAYKRHLECKSGLVTPSKKSLSQGAEKSLMLASGEKRVIILF